MDFGKYRYEEKRKERDERKKQHVLALKEIKFHANVAEHDFLTKVNHIKGFLTDGSLTCALHLSRFDLASGEALDPPADEPLAVYRVTVAEGRLIVDFPG